MRSYSIALLFHIPSITQAEWKRLEMFRQAMPFSVIYVYGAAQSDEIRNGLQKLDIIIRKSRDNDFRRVRRMFTEIDADVLAYIGDVNFEPADAAAMIHQLVEERVDMVVGTLEIAADAVAYQRLVREYQSLCDGLYSIQLASPLSDFRVFSRRFVKSFAAFERGFPIELEWSIHALELDIPYLEHSLSAHPPRAEYPHSSLRQHLTRLIMNLQARPLKWFGLFTSLNLCAMLIYKILFCLSYFGYETHVDQTHSAFGAGIFAILTFLSALSGLALHSISHQKREIKRLHFQQHSTL